MGGAARGKSLGELDEVGHWTFAWRGGGGGGRGVLDGAEGASQVVIYTASSGLPAGSRVDQEQPCTGMGRGDIVENYYCRMPAGFVN